jgi:hypothetical protein
VELVCAAACADRWLHLQNVASIAEDSVLHRYYYGLFGGESVGCLRLW